MDYHMVEISCQTLRYLKIAKNHTQSKNAEIHCFSCSQDKKFKILILEIKKYQLIEIKVPPKLSLLTIKLCCSSTKYNDLNKKSKTKKSENKLLKKKLLSLYLLKIGAVILQRRKIKIRIKHFKKRHFI
ncbi:hypothetical protein BpHYR1_026159 [Brachionus plicatilis]|uniref:Uncharacterized protein n=1 Tax=Brachionus plicatilis TaxID=10195 RepID=A0A3M7T7U1_BRAPC|nr:hypothetical protein BpHYR1_026159 [Brachionus plicatilis]